MQQAPKSGSLRRGVALISDDPFVICCKRSPTVFAAVLGGSAKALMVAPEHATPQINMQMGLNMFISTL
jgi:hypothetical protein